MEKEILDVEEALEFLKTSKPTFYRWLKAGKIHGFKVGKQWRFYLKDLVAFMESTGTDFVLLKGELKSAIAFFEERIHHKDKNVMDKEIVSGSPSEKKDYIEKLIRVIIIDAHLEKAADIHMEPLKEGGLKLKYRLDEGLHTVRSLSHKVSEEAVIYIKEMAGLTTEVDNLPQRGKCSLEIHQVENGARLSLKLGILPTLYGERITLSINATSMAEAALKQGFEALGFKSEDLLTAKSIFDKSFGLIIVTGTPGSGRTTTCHSGLNYVKRRTADRANILSLEDHIDYPMDGIVQAKVDPEGEGQGFYEHLQASLWQDPDVIFISAVPDKRTARMVCEAALTGHMVIVQMNSPDIVQAIVRLMKLTDEPSLLASILEGAISQRLVRCICDHCKEEYTPQQNVVDRYFLKLYKNWFQTRDEAEKDEKPAQHSSDKVTLLRGKGCEKCRQSGFSGRTGLFEIIDPDMEIKDLITVGLGPEKLKEALLEKDFITLREKALFYALSGITTLEEALRVSYT